MGQKYAKNDVQCFLMVAEFDFALEIKEEDCKYPEVARCNSELKEVV